VKLALSLISAATLTNQLLSAAQARESSNWFRFHGSVLNSTLCCVPLPARFSLTTHSFTGFDFPGEMEQIFSLVARLNDAAQRNRARHPARKPGQHDPGGH
jgi:hypothetical protein